MKNNCCFRFERLFKVKKNGIFLSGISFFIFTGTFLYYANEESDDVIGGSTKIVQHSIKNISRNVGQEQSPSNLATEMYITKEAK